MGYADEHSNETDKLVKQLIELRADMRNCAEAIVKAIEAHAMESHNGRLWDSTEEKFAESYHLLD